MKQNLRVSLGAVVLALATLAAMIFAWLNFVQRRPYSSLPTTEWPGSTPTHGVQAQQVSPNSPAARAGIRARRYPADHQRRPVTTQVQVTQRLWRAGLWTQVRYKLLAQRRGV